MAATTDGPTVQWAQADRSVFDELVLAGDLRGAAAFLERRTLSLLADRGAGSVQDAVEELAPHARSLLLRLAAAEAGVRLRARRAAVMPASAGRLIGWANALAVAFSDWQKDQVPRALPVALERLREPPGGGPATPAPELTGLVDPLSPAPTSYRRLQLALATALERLGDDGPAELAALWSGFAAFLWSAFTMADFAASVPVATAAGDRLAGLDSPYEGWIRGTTGYICVLSGDVDAAEVQLAAADRFAERRPADAPTGMVLMVRYARALIALWTQPGPAAFDTLDKVASSYRRHSPPMASAAQAEAAAVLLDAALPEVATGYIERVRLRDPLLGQALSERAAFLVDHDPARIPRMNVLLDVQQGSSWGRRAGIARLRLTRDLRVLGFTAEADAAREEALAALGPPDTLSRWEKLLLDRSDVGEPGRPAAAGPVLPAATAGPAGHPARDRVEVLRPALVVHRHGGPVDLPPLPARLLAVLVAERGPVTLDRLVDLLWPGETVPDSRLKVANAVYRLRRALDLARDELIIRRGEVTELRPGPDWTIDAWEFWAASTGDADDRRRALALYTADLCEQQLAYDDAVAEGRDRLTARWVDLAAGLLAEDPRATDPVLVARRAERIGVSSPSLVALLARALTASGRAAEARMLAPSAPAAAPRR